MFYNIFLINKQKFSNISAIFGFFHLTDPKKIVMIIWRRNNKKFTLNTNKEKIQ